MVLKKRSIKIIIGGVGVGLLLGIVRSVFGINEALFMQYYWITGGAIIVGVVLVSILYFNSYRKKMQKAVALLEEGKTTEYIDTMEILLQKARGRHLKNVIRINLSAGYCDLKQFDKAIQILEGLSEEKLTGELKMIQRLNLCLCYFRTCQASRAVELYEASQKDFRSFRKLSFYGGNFAVLDMLIAIEKGQLEYAEKILETAKKTWNTPRLQNDYLYIEELLSSKKN